MSDMDQIQKWLTDHKIDDVEAFVPDMAGAARGKVLFRMERVAEALERLEAGEEASAPRAREHG